MPVRHKTKTQYVEPSEEHVGEDMKPFIALLSLQENQMEKNAGTSFTLNVTTNTQAEQETKRKVRFWRRITAFFS